LERPAAPQVNPVLAAAEMVLASPMPPKLAVPSKKKKLLKKPIEHSEGDVAEMFKSGWQVVTLYCKGKEGATSRAYKKWVSPSGKRHISEAKAEAAGFKHK